jgi:hypothetical protein
MKFRIVLWDVLPCKIIVDNYFTRQYIPEDNSELRLWVFENRVLRRIFGPKRDEVTGEWRNLHSEELHNLYSSPDIIRQVKSRRMRWAEHVARMGEERKLYKVLVGNPEGNILLGRPRRRWEYWVRMDLRGIGLGGVG